MTATHVTVCDTCTDTSRAGEEGIGAGQGLAVRVAALHAAVPDDALEVHRTRCLMACTEGCVVAVAATGKMQYLLGRWSADDEAAAAILAFARQHADSPTGIVPNGEWPEAVAMRFLGRIPPPEPAPGEEWRDDGGDL